ncbi:MAG TPA: hypothetical protein VFP72_07505, partial [Kineosporiaceae bacterium]|nr:hypothetical protein [Kineosporiaceae bacterium]
PEVQMATSASPSTSGQRHEFVPGFKDERDASANLFDLRYLIGTLFSVYGVVLVIASFFVSRAKANGIDVNLYLGIGMFVLGAVFLVWARTRPLRLEGRSALAEAEEAAVGETGETVVGGTGETVVGGTGEAAAGEPSSEARGTAATPFRR